MSSARPIAHWLLLVALSTIWGISFTFTKIAVTTLPPSTVVAGRLSIGALALMLLVRFLGLSIPRDRTSWAYFAAMAVIGNAVPFFLISWGQRGLDSGLAGILMAIMPVATLVLAHVFVEAEPMSVRRLAGFVLGFAGVVVLVGLDALLGAGESSVLPYELAVLAGALCYAANTIIARRMPDIDPRVSSAAVLGIAAVLMLPISALQDAPWTLTFTMEGVFSVVWLGLISTGLAMVLYFRIIALAGATFLSLINYLIPLIALVAGVVALGESPQWSGLVALTLILAGMGLGQSSARSAKPGRGSQTAE